MTRIGAGIDHVRFWHKADKTAASAFVRFWTITDKGGFWPGTVCPLVTQIKPTKKKRDRCVWH